MKHKPFLIQGLCLAMILFGMHSCFCHTFLPFTSMTKFTVALFVTAMWFTLLSVGPFQSLEQKVRKQLGISWIKLPVADLLILLTFALLAIYILNHTVRIQQDAQILSDAFVFRYDRYYGNVRGRFRLQDYAANGSRLLFSIELLVAFYMAKAFSGRNGMFLGTLPVAALISACLFLGVAPQMVDMICMACGVLGLQMTTGGIHMGGRKGFRQRTTGGRQYRRGYLVAILILALVFSGAGALSVSTADTCLQGEQELLEIQHKMERRIVDASVHAIQRIMMLLGVEQPGVMTNIAPSYTGKTVLTVTTDKKPNSDMYLRGFIGTKYENGRWSNSPAEELQDLNRYQLMTQDYNFIRRMSDASGIMHTTITYAKGNNSSFGYLPYYSQLADESTKDFLMDGDYGLRRDSSVKEYRINGAYFDNEVEYQYKSINGLLKRGGEQETYLSNSIQDEMGAAWAEEIQSYKEFVLERDTWLPETGLEQTKELAQTLLDEGEISLEEYAYNYPLMIIYTLRQFFGATTTYSQNLRMRASKQDYVENFLFQQKKGYCEHYATAGAVIFRAMGVPARYVSGYKVSAEDFKDNGDGTFTAKVIDSKAHAWTEVYLSIGGWTVADMTPPDSRRDVAPSRDINDIVNPTPNPGDDEFLDGSQDSSQKVSPEEEVTPTPEVTDLPEETEEDEETDKQPAESQNADNQGRKDDMSPGTSELSEEHGAGISSVLFLGGVLLALCGLVIFLWNLQALQRHRKLKRCKSHREYILAMNHLLERYLRCCGHRGVSRMEDEEYMRFLGELYPAGKKNGTLEQFYRMLEQARFAREAGSREEVYWCKRLFYQLSRNVIKGCNGPRRFYVRWIRNWRR